MFDKESSNETKPKNQIKVKEIAAVTKPIKTKIKELVVLIRNTRSQNQSLIK